jgi:hypothetical protein
MDTMKLELDIYSEIKGGKKGGECIYSSVFFGKMKN